VLKFIKAHWQILVLIAVGLAILALMQYLDNANDAAIARLLADKAVSRERIAREAIENKYLVLNAAKDAEIIAMKAQRDAKAIEVGKWRASSEAKQKLITELQPCMVLLDDCQQYVVTQEIDHKAALAQTDALCDSRVELKDAEILEWKGKDTRLTNRMGELTEALYKAELKARRKLIIGPQAGYGPGGAYVGFGATFELFRLKMPGVN
jgi:hypothetical protein